MRLWLRSLRDFTIAVARHWGILVTGGFIVGLIALIERLSGKAISGWPLWLAVGLSLFVAAFLAWKNERERWERLNVTTLSKTPSELVDVYKGRTVAQGEALAVIYQGKWLTVSGEVGDVTIHKGDRFFFPPTASVTFAQLAKPTVFMNFGRVWITRLSMLRTGERITVLGQIDNVERFSVWLKKCELLDVPASETKSDENLTV